jgi:hypothetical protein
MWEPGAVVELRLEALRRVELVLQAGGVVEDLGERADDVLAVVEDPGVVAGHADVCRTKTASRSLTQTQAP